MFHYEVTRDRPDGMGAEIAPIKESHGWTEGAAAAGLESYLAQWPEATGARLRRKARLAPCRCDPSHIPEAARLAYEEDVRRLPLHHDGTPRRTWGEIPEYARRSWERKPTPRDWS